MPAGVSMLSRARTHLPHPQALMNEKLSPEILHHQEDVLEEAKRAVNAQVRLWSCTRAAPAATHAAGRDGARPPAAAAEARAPAQTDAIDVLEQQEGAQLERLLMQADTQRIQYLLRSYHR
jgi:hypothetical protein